MAETSIAGDLKWHDTASKVSCSVFGDVEKERLTRTEGDGGHRSFLLSQLRERSHML